MEASLRELLVARIVSGTLRIWQGGRLYLLAHPDAQARYAAQEVYEREYARAVRDGVMADDVAVLRNHGLWDEADEELLKRVRADIDDFKVKLFNNFFKEKEAEVIRDTLKKAREKHDELSARRHIFSFLTAQSLANMARLRYLVGKGLRRVNGEKVFKNFWKKPGACELIDRAVDQMVASRLSEAEYRDLARNEPWTSIWSSKVGTNGVFDRPSTELTDEQRQLILWSNMYEQVGAAHEPPPRQVIGDDDALDGWLIIKKREVEQAAALRGVDAWVTSDKIKNSDEVFIIADSVEKARKISELNSDWARGTKASISRSIAEKGRIEEQHRPDVKLRLQMEMNKGFK